MRRHSVHPENDDHLLREMREKAKGECFFFFSTVKTLDLGPETRRPERTVVSTITGNVNVNVNNSLPFRSTG